MAGSSDIDVIGTTLLDRDIYVTVIITQRYIPNNIIRQRLVRYNVTQ